MIRKKLIEILSVFGKKKIEIEKKKIKKILGKKGQCTENPSHSFLFMITDPVLQKHKGKEEATSRWTDELMKKNS